MGRGAACNGQPCFNSFISRRSGSGIIPQHDPQRFRMERIWGSVTQRLSLPSHALGWAVGNTNAPSATGWTETADVVA